MVPRVLRCAAVGPAAQETRRWQEELKSRSWRPTRDSLAIHTTGIGLGSIAFKLYWEEAPDPWRRRRDSPLTDRSRLLLAQRHRATTPGSNYPPTPRADGWLEAAAPCVPTWLPRSTSRLCPRGESRWEDGW